MSLLKPGERFAERYVIIEQLGEGAMGVVYSARDEKLRRTVAVKMLSPKRVGNKTARSRLKREARAAAALDNPGIAQVFDVGETPDGGAYLVMELVRGQSVRALRKSSLEVAEALRIVREVARTLDAAHRVGLVHRDVKPDNMMVREDGRVVLLDFGIAKDVGHPARSEGGEEAADSVVTGQGAILGTPPYIAPEQIRGRDVGPASDQFALAVVAYLLLTGKKPWESPTELGMFGQILTEPPRRASDAAPSLPEAADAVFARALEKDAKKRFETVEAFADALEAALIEKPAEAPPLPVPTPLPEPTPERMRAPLRSDPQGSSTRDSKVSLNPPEAARHAGSGGILLVILVLVALGAAAAWYATHSGKSAPPADHGEVR